MNKQTLVIAEAGVNHNGSIRIAKKLIDAASKSGADYVKFQTFKTDELVTSKASLASYQKKNLKKKISQYQLLKNLELSESEHKILIRHCKKRKIKFLTTAFDEYSLNFIKKLKLDLIKIPSGEVTNYNYLKIVAHQNKKIILSTGMCTISEVKNALKVLKKYGAKKNQITVLHCSTEYPVPFKNININAMIHMQKILNIKVGYSDHSLGNIVPIIAVANGACVIEKHMTLDKKMKGPDHSASLEPEEFSEMVKQIRNTELILGSNIKSPSQEEINNIPIVRKFIVAKKDIKKGDQYSTNNLAFKRSGENGISPMEWKKLIGKKSHKNYKKDQLIKIKLSKK